MAQRFESNSEQQTAEIAAHLATQAKAGDVFLLEGTLGAGKSVFARAFVRALCGEKTEVPSPTFTLVQQYDSPKGPLWHFDLYRLSDPDEIHDLGWEEALSGGILLVEWPERLGANRPPAARYIRIEPLNETCRRIEIDD